MHNIILKIALCGDEKVGKTAIAKQYSENIFLNDYKMTMASDFITKDITLGDQTVKLQIWDFGGSERFAELREMFYKGLRGAVMTFDLGNKQSFKNLDKWFNEVRPEVIGAKYIIVGNKSDLSERQVTSEEATIYASDRGTDYYEVSAKSGDDIRRIFEALAGKIMGIMVEAPEPTTIISEPIVTSEPVLPETEQEIIEPKPLMITQPHAEQIEQVSENIFDNLMADVIKSDYDALNNRLLKINKIQNEPEKVSATKILKTLINKGKNEDLDEKAKKSFNKARIFLNYLLSTYYDSF